MGLIQGPKGRELGNWHLIAQKPKKPALRRWKERDREQENSLERVRWKSRGMEKTPLARMAVPGSHTAMNPSTAMT